MGTKNADIGHARADEKRAARSRRRLTTAVEVINEPKPDWEHPSVAPFYCFQTGTTYDDVEYIRSADEWVEALYSAMKRRVATPPRPRDEDFDKLLSATPPEWSFSRVGRANPDLWWAHNLATKAPSLRVTARTMGMLTEIQPGLVTAWHDDLVKVRGGVMGRSYDQLFTHKSWYDLYQHDEIAAEWHRWLLKGLFVDWSSCFVRAVMHGAAHIVARKRSVLAPFERVTWDQWRYFELDDYHSRPKNKERRFGDPRNSSRPGWTATGPAGEKLFEIYIAPGVGTSRSSNGSFEHEPEEQCLQWLMELIHQYPERPPKPRDLLNEEAMSRFSGLTANGFLRCFARVQTLAQNQKWSRAGRPPKSTQKSLQQK